MAKQSRTIFICQQCGYKTPKWLGRCPECGQWNCMVETLVSPERRPRDKAHVPEPEKISEISLAKETRIKTGIEEFDRILGGGVVPGSLILIGGEPGIGKSTLLLQVLERFAGRNLKALYITGEESVQQIKLRATRLGINSDNLFVMAETCMENFMEQVEAVSPGIIAVDSIQTIYTDELSSTPGSVSQIREVTANLMNFGKVIGIPVFIIGHVTKEGAIAGPKVLEHMVDTVLYFEGDRGHVYRVLRSVKNRYGSTNEIGVFEMKDTGLEQVGDPSHIFLQERPIDVPGSVVVPCIEGTRPLLLEIQALVGPSPFGVPRRTTVGVDANKISLLVAVLGKRLGIEMGDQDIFINVAGGMRVQEPASDLGIMAAMISSFLNKPVHMDLVVFGEVGLAGEVRAVSQPEIRINEARKLGFSNCVLPYANLQDCNGKTGMKLVGVKSIRDLQEYLFL